MKITPFLRKLMLRESQLSKLTEFHKFAPNCIECIGWLGHSVYIVRLWENNDTYSLEMFPLLHTIKISKKP